jgi:small-conductance mechanosensitive channel
MGALMNALDFRLYGAEMKDWVVAVVAALTVTAALRLAQAYAIRKLQSHATSTGHPTIAFAVDLVRRTAWPVLLAIGLNVGTLIGDLPPNVERIVHALMVTAVLAQFALWLNRSVSFFLDRYFRRTLDEDAARATTITFLGVLVRLALWVVLVLVALDNFGVNVTALVAGLGIGGIAVALATQSILGDVFASLSIVLDKPFVVGDFIVVDQLSGRVEHIGLKTTRVRSTSGEEIIFANGELLKNRIRNYRGSYERRVVFTVGVSYQTPHDRLARIPMIIRDLVQAQEHVRFVRANFAKLAESSLIFEVVYDVLSGDENVYMDVQQAINLGLLARLQREGIELAAPAHALEVRETAVVGQSA